MLQDGGNWSLSNLMYVDYALLRAGNEEYIKRLVDSKEKYEQQQSDDSRGLYNVCKWMVRT